MPFDRTYEGLKRQDNGAPQVGQNLPFDRTYEGLKRYMEVQPATDEWDLLTVPMRV